MQLVILNYPEPGDITAPVNSAKLDAILERLPEDAEVQLLKVHSPSKCFEGPSCAIHNPTDHHMRGWPLYWRRDAAKMERLCPHGVGHPDPDALAFHTRNGRDYMSVHGCDGCCNPDNS